MVIRSLILVELTLLLLFIQIKDSLLEQSQEPSSIVFNLEQAIPLLDPGRNQHDLIDKNFHLQQRNDISNTVIDEDLEHLEDDIEPDFHPPWDLEPIFVPSGGNDLCQAHTQLYLKDLKKWKKWSLQMWDATGKLGSGLFSGNGNQLGDFDLCLEINGPKGFQPNYCLAYIDVETTEETPTLIKEIVNKIQGENFVRTRLNEPGHFIPRFSTLGWGICVPKSCTKDSLEMGLKNSLSRLNSTLGLIVHSGLPKYSCHEKPSTLPIATIITVLFLATVFLTSIVATVLDVINNQWNCNIGTEKRVLMAFSLKRRTKDLFAENTDEFPCIHGIRALCTIIVYVAHRLMPLTSILFTNRILLTKFANTTLSSLLRASNMYTDSFLFLSGVLTSYNLTREIVIKGFIKWPIRILARFIRLTPALLAVVTFYAYIMEHLGSGPQWGTVVSANADLCKSGFWKNLLYIQNFFKFEEMCAPHTHQLALDMQMFLFAPALVYILHNEQRLGIVLTVLIGLASAGLRFYTIYANNLSTYINHGVRMEDLYTNANLSYAQTTHRIIPYLIGVGLGYFLYKSGRIIKINSKVAVLGWILCLIGAFYSIFSQTHLAMKDYVYDSIDAALYAALSPVAWSASLSWIIVMCCINRGGLLEKMLSSRYLLIISRLSYSIYLTQFIAFHYNTGTTKATKEVNPMDAVPFWELVTVLLTSTILTLSFDLPMQEIKNVMLTGSKPRVKSRKPD